MLRGRSDSTPASFPSLEASVIDCVKRRTANPRSPTNSRLVELQTGIGLVEELGPPRLFGPRELVRFRELQLGIRKLPSPKKLLFARASHGR